MLYNAILVTGCGGDVGLGIGKILKQTGIAQLVIGSDMHAQHPGVFIFDHCHVVERVASEHYVESINKLVKKYRIDLIIPASEAELRIFSEKNIWHIGGIPLLMANAKAMKIGFDKLTTVHFLQENGFPYPLTQLVGVGKPSFSPCIIKSRFGRGSGGVTIVDDELVDYYIKHRPDDIWQEFLLPDNQEYTCGLYRSCEDHIRSIIFRRELDKGTTVYGEVVQDADIESLLVNVANSLDLRGSINVQLRKTDKGPIIFEINPRYSGTSFFRHLLGFCDLIWALKEHKKQCLDSYNPLHEKVKFYRAYQEFIVPVK